MGTLLIFLASILVGGAGGYGAHLFLAKRKKEKEGVESEKLLENAKLEAKDIILSAKDRAMKGLTEIKNEEQNRQIQWDKMEKRLGRMEKSISFKERELRNKWGELKRKVKELKDSKEEIGRMREKQMEKLRQITKLTPRKAKDLLLKSVEEEYQDEIKEQIERFEKERKEVFEEKARDIITLAIQRYAAGHVVDHTTSTVALASDDLKGRIIGREGRNINTIERLTGAEVIVDDTPQAIVISSFDPIRREIAKQALERLVEDGRIHPARIEETIDDVKKEINKKIEEAGETAMYEVGVTGINPKLVKLLGRLRYRTSYGQNILLHSMEVAHIAGALAAELGCDISVAKKAGLLHDIGKAIDREVQGTHVKIGMNILKKFDVPDEIIDAMKSHHGDYSFESKEATLVAAADAVSAARPGARKDTVEDYLKRIEEIEEIANSFDEVDKSYAIQAGREVRVFVSPDTISDLESTKLARKIADKIEGELKYPGEIKIVVIRETRAMEYAR